MLKLPEGTELAETDVLVADTAPAEAEALEIPDTAEAEAIEEADTEQQETDTRDFDKEIEEARKQAAEEARQSFEEESVIRAHRERSQNQSRWLATQAANEAEKFAQYIVGKLDSGEMTGAQLMASIKPDNLARGWAGQLAAAVQSEQLATAYSLQDETLKRQYPEWRIPSDLARAKENAIANADTVKLYTLRDEIWRRAVLENEVPKEAQKVAAETAAKNKKATDVEKVRDGDKARAQSERPTAVSGGAALDSKQSARTVLEDPNASLKQKQSAYKAIYGRDYGS